MTDERAEGAGRPVDETAEAAEARRRRRAAVFGEVLPESTSDDREPGEGDAGGHEEWLRRNVPPHHG